MAETPAHTPGMQLARAIIVPRTRLPHTVIRGPVCSLDVKHKVLHEPHLQQHESTRIYVHTYVCICMITYVLYINVLYVIVHIV